MENDNSIDAKLICNGKNIVKMYVDSTKSSFLIESSNNLFP